MLKKKKIKVYLQYPWKFPDSPYYKYLIDYPPKNIEYLNIKRQRGVITNKKIFWFSHKLKRIIRNFFNLFKFSIPNAHLIKTKVKYDLIHCAHCFSLNKNKPWVADFEEVWQFYIGEKTKKGKEKVRKILESKNCKKILLWTESAKREIISEFPEIKNKIVVVYPAVSGEKNFKKSKNKKLKIIFSGRYFYGKGGLHALEAIDILTKKYKNVEGIINSKIPPETLKKYFKNKKIKFYELIPQKELFELYKKSDILIYPGYSDTFGFAYLESMSFGIPIITVDRSSRKEIIQKEKTGFIIERDRNSKVYPSKKEGERIIEELVKKTSTLIENEKLREKMSKNCIEIIKNGKFSTEKRNKQLRRIYEEALR